MPYLGIELGLSEGETLGWLLGLELGCLLGNEDGYRDKWIQVLRFSARNKK
jgi:hypothetical protein